MTYKCTLLVVTTPMNRLFVLASVTRSGYNSWLFNDTLFAFFFRLFLDGLLISGASSIKTESERHGQLVDPGFSKREFRTYVY